MRLADAAGNLASALLDFHGFVRVALYVAAIAVYIAIRSGGKEIAPSLFLTAVRKPRYLYSNILVLARLAIAESLGLGPPWLAILDSLCLYFLGMTSLPELELALAPIDPYFLAARAIPVLSLLFVSLEAAIGGCKLFKSACSAPTSSPAPLEQNACITERSAPLSPPVETLQSKTCEGLSFPPQATPAIDVSPDQSSSTEQVDAGLAESGPTSSPPVESFHENLPDATDPALADELRRLLTAIHSFRELEENSAVMVGLPVFKAPFKLEGSSDGESDDLGSPTDLQSIGNDQLVVETLLDSSITNTASALPSETAQLDASPSLRRSTPQISTDTLFLPPSSPAMPLELASAPSQSSLRHVPDLSPCPSPRRQHPSHSSHGDSPPVSSPLTMLSLEAQAASAPQLEPIAPSPPSPPLSSSRSPSSTSFALPPKIISPMPSPPTISRESSTAIPQTYTLTVDVEDDISVEPGNDTPFLASVTASPLPLPSPSLSASSLTAITPTPQIIPRTPLVSTSPLRPLRSSMQTSPLVSGLHSSPDARAHYLPDRLCAQLKRIGREAVVINLAALLRPHLMVIVDTAFRQRHAALVAAALDRTSGVTFNPQDPFYLYSLFTESPQWDRLRTLLDTIADCVDAHIEKRLRESTCGQFIGIAVVGVCRERQALALSWLLHDEQQHRVRLLSKGSVFFPSKASALDYQHHRQGRQRIDLVLTSMAEAFVSYILHDISKSMEREPWQTETGVVFEFGGLSSEEQGLYDPCDAIISSARVIRLQAPRIIDLTYLCNHDMWPFRQARQESSGYMAKAETVLYPSFALHAESERSFLERKERWKRFRKQQQLLTFHFIAIGPSRNVSGEAVDAPLISPLSSPSQTTASSRRGPL